jgi:membrane-associated HD superfamily phosphohydrolase
MKTMNTTKTIAIIAAILIALVVGTWMLKVAMLPIFTVTKQIDSAHDIIEDVYTPESAICNYEWFKQQYQDIEATERIIRNTKTEMNAYKEMYGSASDWDWQTKKDYNSLQDVYLGQQNYYEGLVADYNARSEMANRNIFKDKLPLHVDKVIW